MQRSAKAYIDCDALRHNLSQVKKHAPNSKVMCAIKANAYGHGLVQAAKALYDADGFAVANLSEALELRRNGIAQSILVLQGPKNSDDVSAFEQHRISAVIHHESQLPLLQNANMDIWLKANTGMNRLGFLPSAVADAVAFIKTCSGIALQGLFTHMADADYADSRDTTENQLALLNSLNQEAYPLSIANSASLLFYPKAQQDWVRPGIMMYGVNPFVEPASVALNLQAVMTLSAPIIAINTCLKNEKVGYAGEWQAKRDSKIAVIAIGYGDGYPRHAGNNTPVLINGRTYPLVGRVSMDLITVDITDAKNISLHDEAILWGGQLVGDKNIRLPVEKIAECADTIAYELLCSVYGRVSYYYN